MCFSFSKGIDLILQEDGGVIFDATSEKFYGLDHVGVIICSMLKEHRSAEEIIELVVAQFDADKTRVATDVNNFLIALTEKKLVTIYSEE
jgi:hypothetical protein